MEKEYFCFVLNGVKHNEKKKEKRKKKKEKMKNQPIGQLDIYILYI
jgi:hypothetical protein